MLSLNTITYNLKMTKKEKGDLRGGYYIATFKSQANDIMYISAVIPPELLACFLITSLRN